MYERAATSDVPHRGAKVGPPPVWHVGQGRSLFIGALGHNAAHSHSVPVYLAGLYGSFRLRVGAGAWTSCRTCVIPAGVPYEFDIDGEPLAVLYLEPDVAGACALVPLVRNGSACEGAVIGSGGDVLAFRHIYESEVAGSEIAAALDDLLSFGISREERAIDVRIRRALAALAREDAEPVGVAEAAREVGLSASRFQHLFASEVGVPYRRFRVWQRLRVAIADIAGGSSFTAAAHGAGFFDQAHFARAFRQTFGAAPSPSLRHVRPSLPV